MSYRHFASKSIRYLRIGLTSLALFQFSVGGPLASSVQAQEANAAKTKETPADNDGNTRSPIKHVIVIIGENRSFDHVYATYQPAKGQTVSNLLSKEIVNEEGKPGPNWKQAAQFAAQDKTTYAIDPTPKTQYANIPPAGTDGAPTVASD